MSLRLTKRFQKLQFPKLMFVKSKFIAIKNHKSSYKKPNWGVKDYNLKIYSKKSDPPIKIEKLSKLLPNVSTSNRSVPNKTCNGYFKNLSTINSNSIGGIIGEIK